MKPGIPVPVRLTAYKDRTFQFLTLTPPTTWFLKKCANIEKGSAKPSLETVGKVTLKQIYEIAAIKRTDAHVNHIPIENICRSIIGTARSMGVEVISGKEGPKAAAAKAQQQAKAAATAAAAPAASGVAKPSGAATKAPAAGAPQQAQAKDAGAKPAASAAKAASAESKDKKPK